MSQPDEYQYHSIWTPELVELNLPLAGLARRCIAMLIDQVLLGLLLIACWIGLLVFMALIAPAFRGLGSHMAAEMMIVIVIVLLLLSALSQILYFWGFHTFNNGQTLGKQWLHIQVVTDRGGKASGLTHLMRSIASLLDMLLISGSVGALMILLTRQEKRIADYAAGTIVVLVPDK